MTRCSIQKRGPSLSQRYRGIDFEVLEPPRGSWRNSNGFLSLIEFSPEMFPKYDAELRFAVLRRFPFSVVYHPQPRENLIVAVAHSSRSPGYWQDRS